MTKTQASHVQFANFAINHGLKPVDLADLIDLADKTCAAQTREANGGRSADHARKKFADKAQTFGFETDYSGLRPHLIKNGQSIYLPIMNR